MINLILDSNIWLNALKDSGEENNVIDAIEFWVNGGFVTILLPDIIATEWTRNRQNKKDTLVRDYQAFFNQAKKYFSHEEVNRLKTPEVLGRLAEEQLSRIEKIFNEYAVRLEITQDCKLEALQMAEEKKAPWGQKNSVGDAYIFITMRNHIELNGLSDCVFITNNSKDFSDADEASTPHKDLAEAFTRLGIAYYIDIRRFIHDYKGRLPDYSGHAKSKLFKAEEEKLHKSLELPQTVESLEGFRESFIDNINLLDVILKNSEPTRDQVIFALNQLKKGDKYEEYFFHHAKGEHWLNVLEERGYFDPKNNPAPVETDGGFMIPSWHVLMYLHTLSEEIKAGKHFSVAPRIIEMIENISEKPIDNHRTWHMVIKILVNLPNEQVTEKILSYLPVWLSGRFNTMLQSSSVCSHLIPKFLSDKPTKEDVQKAELIFRALFSLRKVSDISDDGVGDERYVSVVYRHYLKRLITEKEIVKRIAQHLSVDSVYFLVTQIRTILLDVDRKPVRTKNGVIVLDFHSLIHSNSFGELDNDIKSGEGIKVVFPLALRNILLSMLEVSPEKAKQIISTIAFSDEYAIAFFRRMVFYLIDKEWEQLKDIFWKMIGSRDDHEYFTWSPFHVELYGLVSAHQGHFTSEQRLTIEKIIETGPKDDRETSYAQSWTHRWNRALAGHKEERPGVTLLSREVDHLLPTPAEIAAKPHPEIIEYLKTIQPRDSWNDPNPGDAASVLEKAIIENPSTFAGGLSAYHDLEYIYSYHIIRGFEQAWKDTKKFDWTAVLEYVENYINDVRFGTDTWEIPNDGWGANADWVIGVIGNLITAGSSADENAFDIALHPLAIRILYKLSGLLKPVERPVKDNFDAAFYSLNSSEGKLLRAVLDLSLREARNNTQADRDKRWNPQLQFLFEAAEARKIIDAFILEGMYFGQFYYLDKDWIASRIRDNYALPPELWAGFMGGYAFGNPMQDQAVFELFLPHYKRALQEKQFFKTMSARGIIRHFVAIYFWGFAGLQEGIIAEFLQEASQKQVEEFLHFILSQMQYLETMHPEDKAELQDRILDLWKHLGQKYEDATSKEDRKIVSGLAHLLPFAKELNEDVTQLMVQSVSMCDDAFYDEAVLEELLRLTTTPDAVSLAENIGQIMSAFSFPAYIYEPNHTTIQGLVKFLYGNDQRAVADQICEAVTSNDNSFLRDIYNAYRK